MDIEQELRRLQIEIIEKELALIEYEAQLVELEQEIAEFKSRYDSQIVPLEKKLKATEDAITDLERQRRISALGDDAPQYSRWAPPEDYVSVQDQFNRAWKKDPDYVPPAPKITAMPTDNSEDAARLKKLYRQLASRFHPDLTTDPDDRRRRHEIMAKINEAYAKKDYDGLNVLSKQADLTPDQPLEALKLQELRQLRDQLNERIEWLNSRRLSIMHSALMDLKLEAQLASKVGRDLLTEMATQLRTEIQAAQAKLAQLRR
jgi:hypothetical protein